MTEYYLYVDGADAQRTELPLSINRWGISTVFSPEDLTERLTKEDAKALAELLNKYSCHAKVKAFTSMGS